MKRWFWVTLLSNCR